MDTCNIAEQIIAEIQSNKVDVNRLKYGEISMIIQDNQLVMINLRKTIKIGTNSKNERSGPRA